jgi:hypothetical protein
METDLPKYRGPYKYGSFQYCYRCGGHNTGTTKSILLVGHCDTGEYTCEFHEDAVIVDIRQYEKENLIFDLSRKIDHNIKVLRSNGDIDEEWSLSKCPLFDGIGVTFLLNDEVMIRVAKYNKNIIQFCKDIKFIDLINYNHIDPLTLDLPESILEKLGINININQFVLKFVD